MHLEELTIEQYEAIQRYLDDLMPTEEENQFRKQLKINKELEEAMEFEREIRNYLHEKKEKEFLISMGIDPVLGFDDTHNIRGVVEKIGLTWKQKKNKTFYLRPFFLYAVAASFLGFIALAIWKTQDNKSNTIAKIKTNTTPTDKKADSQTVSNTQIEKQTDLKAFFNEYFAMDKLPAKQPELLADAFADYKKGKYEKLMQLKLANLPEPPQTRDASEDESEDSANKKDNVLQLGHYYKGLVLLKENKIAEAKTSLQWVIRNAKTDSLKLKSKWYLALIYLDYDSSASKIVPLLKDVSAGKVPPFNDKAKELLRKLNN